MINSTREFVKAERRFPLAQKKFGTVGMLQPSMFDDGYGGYERANIYITCGVYNANGLIIYID